MREYHKEEDDKKEKEVEEEAVRTFSETHSSHDKLELQKNPVNPPIDYYFFTEMYFNCSQNNALFLSNNNMYNYAKKMKQVYLYYLLQ